MDQIRLATQEEIEAISKNANLSSAVAVYAFGKDDPELAVHRVCHELDPVYFKPKRGLKRMLLFMWGLETHLRLSQVPEYYFNVTAKDTEFQKAIETFGAERLSVDEEFRYKRVLQT